jgi:hypothetical protein
MSLTREQESKARAVFIGDYLHLETPIDRHVRLDTRVGTELQPILEGVASSIRIGPGSGLPRWSAHAVVGVRRQHHGGSAIDVTWIATSENSPVDRIDAILSVESSGLDHTRLGIEAGAGVVSDRAGGDARWLTEEVCRAALRAVTDFALSTEKDRLPIAQLESPALSATDGTRSHKADR